jgi:hypothetical protein
MTHAAASATATSTVATANVYDRDQPKASQRPRGCSGDKAGALSQLVLFVLMVEFDCLAGCERAGSCRRER